MGEGERHIRERVLFFGTQFSNLYTAVDTSVTSTPQWIHTHTHTHTSTRASSLCMPLGGHARASCGTRRPLCCHVHPH
jgi:hypothetical protein